MRNSFGSSEPAGPGEMCFLAGGVLVRFESINASVEFSAVGER
jgi:hypothetical protein